MIVGQWSQILALITVRIQCFPSLLKKNLFVSNFASLLCMGPRTATNIQLCNEGDFVI